MRLLMVSGDRSVASKKPGAFARTLEGLAPHFERIDVLCPRTGEAHTEQVLPNVWLHTSPASFLSHPFWIAKKGKELHAEHDYDVVTVHDFPPHYTGLGAWLLWKKIHVPTVLEVHHLVGRPRAADWKERVGSVLQRCWIPFAARWVTAIRTVNTGVLSTLVRLGINPLKLHLVPSFYLDQAKFEHVRSLPRTVLYDLVTAARLVPNKGMDAVLHAVAKVPQVTLLIIGDGPERTTLEQQSRSLGITDRVKFVGWLPSSDEVYLALRSAKLFVMNSLSEGGPRSALEAMACGVPVLATKVGVMPEVLLEGVTGVFTSGEPEDLAKQIQTLLRSASLQQMGTAAAESVKRFEGAVLIQRYAEFLKSSR